MSIGLVSLLILRFGLDVVVDNGSLEEQLTHLAGYP